MSAYQILAVCGTVLGLLLTVALSIAGWVISGQRAKLSEMTAAINAVQHDMSQLKLTMISEYVKDHELQKALERLYQTMEKVSSGLDTTNSKLEGLAITFAKIEGANAAAISKGG